MVLNFTKILKFYASPLQFVSDQMEISKHILQRTEVVYYLREWI